MFYTSATYFQYKNKTHMSIEVLDLAFNNPPKLMPNPLRLW